MYLIAQTLCISENIRVFWSTLYFLCANVAPREHAVFAMTHRQLDSPICIGTIVENFDVISYHTCSCDENHYNPLQCIFIVTTCIIYSKLSCVQCNKIKFIQCFIVRIFWWWNYWKYAQYEYMEGTCGASKNLCLRDHSVGFPFHPSCQSVWWHTFWWANYKFCS
jgi:hypothetical protein